MMEIAEYALLVYTSSLTLNVCGIAKVRFHPSFLGFANFSAFQEIVTLILAHHYKGDEFSPVNIVGLVLCVSGVSLHVYSRAKAASTDTNKKGLSDSREDELGLISHEEYCDMVDFESRL